MSTIDFEKMVSRLRMSGFDMRPDKVRLQVPNARLQLWDGLRYFLGDDAQWLTCYADVADWLTDNKGRGLLCVGDWGLGKTLLCSTVIPAIVLSQCGKVMKNYSAIEINEHVKEILKSKLVIIDDIGTEPDSNIYGEHHDYFSEIVDNAEKKGHLLILTTNLRTTHKIGEDGPIPSIEDRYGIRTLDRLRAITKVVEFYGESFRIIK